MKSLKQPAATLSKGADNTERMDLSQTLREIDSVELSLDVEHVMLHAGCELPLCSVE
jgi:hypothetical protein